jgi:hypothetical protein
MLGEALLILTGVSLAIKLAPFKRVVQAAGKGSPPVLRSDAAARHLVRQARWAVQAWADRVPWKAVCFQRGLALHLMLQRRGLPSRLHYGIAQTPGQGLKAHVWISSAGTTIIGGEDAGGFTCVAAFPPTSSE